VIVTAAVEAYIAGLIPEPDPVLAEMQEHGRREGIPIVHATTGLLLEVLATASGAHRAVEVGTAIGVSTLHLARGGAHVTSFEVDAARHTAAGDYLARAGLADRVDLRLKDASEGLSELEPGSFDLAFIDGPKYLYSDHVEPVIALLRSGGLLLVDNVLISGAAATQEPTGNWDSDRIQEMRAFNARLVEHPQLRTTITPVGDGVAVSVRQ
jgi:predicted O-methyltransferase YrrM